VQLHKVAFCCRRMSEAQFWARYFALVGDLIDSEISTPGPGPVEGSSRAGSAPPTSKSALSGWEDVKAGDGDFESSSSQQQPPGDDLDQYLQACWPPQTQSSRPSCLEVAVSTT
jgi:hypothetical protein